MKKEKVFLAATEVEDFWDTSYLTVFLGDWCKRYGRKKFWEDIESETMPSYFDEKESDEVYRYLNTVFGRLLFVLHKQMNRIHGVNFSPRYWRIILGTWLMYYIHVMYDRYKNLEYFIKLYPDFTSICLDKGSFIIPKDTMHFVNHIKNADYNLQIYSNILFRLGYQLPTKRLTIAVPDVRFYYAGRGQWLKKVLKKAYELTCKTFQNKNKVFLKNAYFSYHSLFKLIVKTRGAAWPCDYSYQDLPERPIDHDARAILGDIDFGENKFERMLGSLIAFDIPQSLVEGFSFLKKKAKDDFEYEPKAIMSATSWGFDNTFQLWAAESAEKGTMLLGVQHGGNYGIAKNLLQEDIELGIVDRFYSWGWKRYDTFAEVIPMPAPKLIVEGKKKSRKGNNGVLYVTTNYFRYSLQFPWLTNYWENYFLNQTLFISHLSEIITSQLRIRPHREDLGCDVRDRMRDQFPQIKIENWDISFLDSLSQCSVYVSDHPFQSTTFIEALRNNRPTIIFYNPDFAANAVRDEAVDLFNQLKNHSIIFDNPVTAAEQLNSVYGSIESWWNEPKRQGAVRNFLDKFGKTTPDWLADWSEEISSVLEGGNKRIIVKE